MTDYGNLCDYSTGDALRPATREEALASARAAKEDGGAGVIDINGIGCYVEATGPDEDDRDRDDSEEADGADADEDAAETEAEWEARREDLVNDLVDALGEVQAATGFDLHKMVEAAVERNPNVTLDEIRSMWADVVERCAADDDELTRVEGVDL